MGIIRKINRLYLPSGKRLFLNANDLLDRATRGPVAIDPHGLVRGESEKIIFPGTEKTLGHLVLTSGVDDGSTFTSLTWLTDPPLESPMAELRRSNEVDGAINSPSITLSTFHRFTDTGTDSYPEVLRSGGPRDWEEHPKDPLNHAGRILVSMAKIVDAGPEAQN